MVEQIQPDGVAARYDGYVTELREFFASRSVRFGQPEDVVAFAALVSQPGPFQEEMGSMLRSILYYEDERLSREDLLMLVTLAVGETPLQPEIPGLDDALRQLFRFVNMALRQRGSVIPPEMDGEPDVQADEAVTAGDILGSEASPGQGPIARLPEPVPDPAPVQGADGRTTPTRDNVLFRAVTMSEQAAESGVPASTFEVPAAPKVQADVAPSSPAPRQPRGMSWLVPAGAFSAAAAVVVYLFWPMLMNLTGANHLDTTAVAGAAVPAHAAVPPRTCVPPATSGVSRAALEERSFIAHNLMDQQMYGAALQQLHAIAMTDPGFPGVHLDESDALLQIKQPERARAAVEAQIGISECLAGLPSASLDAYCTTQFSSSAVSACRPQLAHIRQAAELQAALVHLELGHRMDGDGGEAAALRQLQQDDANDLSQGRSAKPARSATVVPPPRAGRD